MSKNLITALAALVAGVLVLAAAYLFLAPTTFNGTQIDPPKPVSDFTLTSDSGPVRLSDLHGKYVVVYFGYTFCPDICPATLSKLNRALEQVGKDAEKVAVVMVTVDPERDTAEKLGPYVRRFNPNFIGLSGTPEEIAAVAKDIGIFYEKREVSTSAGYLVDHTASVLVLNPEGQIRLIWPYEVQADQAAADLRALLRER